MRQFTVRIGCVGMKSKNMRTRVTARTKDEALAKGYRKFFRRHPVVIEHGISVGGGVVTVGL